MTNIVIVLEKVVFPHSNGKYLPAALKGQLKFYTVTTEIRVGRGYLASKKHIPYKCAGMSIIVQLHGFFGQPNDSSYSVDSVKLQKAAILWRLSN